MELFTALVERASSFLWDYLLLFLLVGTGIFSPSGCGAYSCAALGKGSIGYSATLPSTVKKPARMA